MSEETTEELQAILLMLKTILIKNNVSMGIQGSKLLFFDTDAYCKDDKYDGFSVDINDLVRE